MSGSRLEAGEAGRRPCRASGYSGQRAF